MMGEFLFYLQVAAHLLTFAAVAIWYTDPTARYRPGVSILATLIAGASLAGGVGALLSGGSAGVFATIMLVLFCGLVLRAGGNIAKLLPRQPWSAAP